MSNTNTIKQEKKVSIVETFMKGSKKGLYIGLDLIAPAMIMAYALIAILTVTGLMPIIGKYLSPIMAIFGLPGEATVVLIAAFFAKAAGAASALLLYEQGLLDRTQATILFPTVIIMGTLVGHFARVVLVSNVEKKFHKILLMIPLIDAIIVMAIMKVVVKFYQ